MKTRNFNRGHQTTLNSENSTYDLVQKLKCEEIFPIMITESELATFSKQPIRGKYGANEVGYVYRTTGGELVYICKGDEMDISSLKTCSQTNLIRYADTEVFFDKAGETEFFKIDSPLLLHFGRTAMLMEKVQKAIEERFGDDVYYVISDQENLYVVEQQKNLKNEIDKLDSYPPAWMETEYTVFEMDSKGQFGKVRKLKR